MLYHMKTLLILQDQRKPMEALTQNLFLRGYQYPKERILEEILTSLYL